MTSLETLLFNWKSDLPKNNFPAALPDPSHIMTDMPVTAKKLCYQGHIPFHYF
jgi:hypothetical protein